MEQNGLSGKSERNEAKKDANLENVLEEEPDEVQNGKFGTGPVKGRCTKRETLWVSTWKGIEAFRIENARTSPNTT